MLRVYVTFSLFLKIWLTELILIFGEQFFRETCWSSLASYCLLTLYVTILFPMKKRRLHWNGAACTCKEKSWRKLAGEYQISKSEYPWNEKNIPFTWLSSLYNPFKDTLKAYFWYRIFGCFTLRLWVGYFMCFKFTFVFF